MNEHIGIFERLARQLVEGAFERPFGQRKLLQKIARQIAEDVEKTALAGKLSNSYTIQLHPDTLDDLLLASPNVQEYLNDYLSDLTHEYGLKPSASTGISVVTNGELKRDRVLVRAESNSTTRELTVRSFRPSEQNVLSAIEKIDAFLIVDGKRHVKVRQPIITIGRHLESDIILDDSTVSRQHSQIRWQHDRFILFDLGSKGGTLVNNHPVRQHTLINGDVIRIGQSALIYGEESFRDEERASDAEPAAGSTRQLPGHSLE